MLPAYEEPEFMKDVRQSFQCSLIQQKHYDTNWDQTILSHIMKDIFSGRLPHQLEETESQKYNGNYLTNGEFHYDFASSLITRTEKEKRSLILSQVSITKKPVLDIHVHSSLSKDGNVEFSVSGRDLRKYFQFLPKMRIGNVYYPRTGGNYSKWYPQQSQEMILGIATLLRLLDIYIKQNHVQISDTYTVSSSNTGILGPEVSFDIPESFSSLSISPSEIKSDRNPSKIKEGVFQFKLNGLQETTTSRILRVISDCPQFGNVFPYLLRIENLKEFFRLGEHYKFGIFTWKSHARILHIVDKKVYVLDPWRKFNNDDMIPQMNSVNVEYTCVFVSRNIIDQCKSEGSCVLSAISRMLFLVSKDGDVSNYYSQPIPDFFAFLASFFYRKSLS